MPKGDPLDGVVDWLPKRGAVGVDDEAAPEVDGLPKEKAMLGQERFVDGIEVEIDYASQDGGSMCTAAGQLGRSLPT